MIGRQRAVALEIDVASVAVSDVPLVLVLVAAETSGHLRAQLGRLRLRDSDVAPHAVPFDVRHMGSVLEAQMLTRKFCASAHEGLAVTGATSAFVVRLGVAAAASGVGRKVKRAGVAREGDARVARDAVDPLDHVRAMLERVRRRRLSEAEHTGACGEHERRDEKKRTREGRKRRPARRHRISSERDRRRSALVS
jgi:hypothetical protein